MASHVVNTINLPSGDSIILDGILYANCTTAASTQVKTVSITGVAELYEGLSVRISFANAQTYNGQPTLQVNSLTAKSVIRRSGDNAAQYEWKAGDVLDFFYNGTNWVIVNSDDVATMAETMSYLGISSS